jgi:hypothetical protein
MALRIRQGDSAPVTVAEFAFPPISDLGFLCPLVGQNRIGDVPEAGFLQRLGVSPDGSIVVFETTNAFSILPLDALPPEQEGFFVVRADGSGLRRLSAASREPCHITIPDPASPVLFRVWLHPWLAFSPDGRTIAYTDRGPGPDGEEATQIVTLDLDTGTRTQVTHLPFAPPPDTPSPQPPRPATSDPWFKDNETIGFASYSNPDALNPEGSQALFYVQRDGSRLQRATFPMALPGGVVMPQFQITGADVGIGTLRQPGTPENARPFGSDMIQETFLFTRDSWLQLTNFHRVDTSGVASVDGRSAFILASDDPFGTNPTENCQMFSISRTGSGLRQLTSFSEGASSTNGCGAAGISPKPLGCNVSGPVQDPKTATLVFGSQCDPLGANPYGIQIFSMRPDGTELRQLTDFRGFVVQPDGTATYDWPSTIAYGPWR